VHFFSVLAGDKALERHVDATGEAPSIPAKDHRWPGQSSLGQTGSRPPGRDGEISAVPVEGPRMHGHADERRMIEA
jgi:hypothetical protein